MLLAKRTSDKVPLWRRLGHPVNGKMMHGSLTSNQAFSIDFQALVKSYTVNCPT